MSTNHFNHSVDSEASSDSDVSADSEASPNYLGKPAPHANCCLMSGDTFPPAVPYAVLPHLSPLQTKRYAYYLGVDKSEFSHGSEHNTIYLSPDLLESFDRGEWVLLPVLEVAQEIHDKILWCRQQQGLSPTFLWPRFDDAFPRKERDFIALPLSKEVWANKELARKLLGLQDSEELSKAFTSESRDGSPGSAVETSSPPSEARFPKRNNGPTCLPESLPRVKSFLNPVFAISNADRKMLYADLDLEELKKSAEQEDWIEVVDDINWLWSIPLLSPLEMDTDEEEEEETTLSSTDLERVRNYERACEERLKIAGQKSVLEASCQQEPLQNVSKPSQPVAVALHGSEVMRPSASGYCVTDPRTFHGDQQFES